MGSRLAGVAATFLLAAGVMQFVAHAQLSLPAHAQELPIAHGKELRNRLPCLKPRRGSSFTPAPWRS